MSISLYSRPNRATQKILLAAAFLGASSAWAAQNSGVVLSPVTKIPAYELWSLSLAQHANGGNVVATYWAFDQESGLYENGLKKCGILLMGSPDTGSQPATFEVRGKECSYVLNAAKEGEPLFYLKNDHGRRETIKVLQDGAIYLGKKFLAKIKI